MVDNDGADVCIFALSSIAVTSRQGGDRSLRRLQGPCTTAARKFRFLPCGHRDDEPMLLLLQHAELSQALNRPPAGSHVVGSKRTASFHLVAFGVSRLSGHVLSANGE